MAVERPRSDDFDRVYAVGGGTHRPRAAPVARRRGVVQRHVRLSLGVVLGRLFRTFGSSIPLYALLAVLLNAPLTLLVLEQQHAAFFETRAVRSIALVGFLGQVGSFLAGLALQCIVAYGVYARLSGRPVGLLASMRGLRRFFVVLGVALLVGVMMWGSLLVLAVLGSLAGLLPGLLFLAAGGVVALIFYCTYFVAAQAAIVEPFGVGRAMARGAWLSSGSRWPILALLLLGYGVLLGGTYLLQRAVFETPTTWNQVVLQRASLEGLGALVNAFLAVAAAVVYYELRRAKEGIGIEEILDVFA